MADGLAGLTDLLNLLNGKPGSTTTTQDSVDPAQMQALLQNLLNGTQGLASLTQGAHSAGLYNSSTSGLLANNLIAQAAAQVAALNKQQTQTTTNQSPLTADAIKKLIAAMAANKAMGGSGGSKGGQGKPNTSGPMTDIQKQKDNPDEWMKNPDGTDAPDQSAAETNRLANAEAAASSNFSLDPNDVGDTIQSAVNQSGNDMNYLNMDDSYWNNVSDNVSSSLTDLLGGDNSYLDNTSSDYLNVGDGNSGEGVPDYANYTPPNGYDSNLDGYTFTNTDQLNGSGTTNIGDSNYDGYINGTGYTINSDGSVDFGFQSYGADDPFSQSIVNYQDTGDFGGSFGEDTNYFSPDIGWDFGSGDYGSDIE